MKKQLELLKEKFSFITEIRGMGLLIGLEMSEDFSSKIVTESLDKGLLINAVRPNMIRFMPPLNVSKTEIDSALEIIESILEGLK